jgi:filamentous hemagglutinin
MDLDDSTAQSVLEKSLPAGKQRYGFHDGKLYEFQPDNVGGWHGYPILGNKAPPSVLKSLRSEGCITGAEFNKLRKGE